MNGDEQKIREPNRRGWEVEHHSAHDLGEADVPFRDAVMLQMRGLNDEEREVGSLRIEKRGLTVLRESVRLLISPLQSSRFRASG